MRGRTANELKKRAKYLLAGIQREYEEFLNKKPNMNPLNVTVANDANKENDREFDRNKSKKLKRKSWMPTISFATATSDEPTPKKPAKSAKFGDMSSQPSTSHAVASTSGLANRLFASARVSLDMPILD